MKLEHRQASNADLLIDLNGEMDALGCGQIRPDIERIVSGSDNSQVILNLSEVSFLDSSGIGVIVFLFKRLKAAGRKLIVTGVQGQPRELMELLRIDSAIPVFWAAPELSCSDVV